MNKKGQAVGIMVLVSVFLFAITGLIMYHLFTEINTSMQADDSISDRSKGIMSSNVEPIKNWTEGSVLLIFGFMSFAALVLAGMVIIRPLFLGLSLFLIILEIIVARYFSDIYTRVAESSSLAATSATFTITPFVMDKLPWLTFILAIILGVVMYGRSRL